MVMAANEKKHLQAALDGHLWFSPDNSRKWHLMDIYTACKHNFNKDSNWHIGETAPVALVEGEWYWCHVGSHFGPLLFRKQKFYLFGNKEVVRTTVKVIHPLDMGPVFE